ncbi:MAG: hypothetical protein Q4A00_06455 [Flavobacteriaceae bacterium]|nr:hypothetical protein [Flavobacteriaceae bacterium]
MNFKLFLGIGLWFSILFVACRKDEIAFNTPSQRLSVSADTIIMDTVYHQIRSATYVAKIFNRENKNVKIPRIYLGQGENSQYKINVDGKSGHQFTNVPIRAKDSLFIFVEIFPKANAKELVAEDHIFIETPLVQQKITLLSLVQDAEFFISSADKPKIIDKDTSWDTAKAKIILGEVQLAEGKTLSINKGTRIYFMPNSGLKINKNATLNINGDLNEEVILRGYRNEARYDTLPKNWDKILLEEGSKLNMNYAKIFGGTTGLHLNHSNATIKNSIIHTFQDYGIFAINSQINAENMVINNTGISNINIVKGGNYHILHSTLANYWSFSHNSSLAVFAQNHYTTNENKEVAPLEFSFKNSIAYTQKNNAIQFDFSEQNFNYQIESSLIKYGNNAGYQWENNPAIINSIKNEDPLFVSTFISKMNLSLKDNSPAKGKGNPQTAQSVPLDIKKINRSNTPNMGAYQ